MAEGATINIKSDELQQGNAAGQHRLSAPHNLLEIAPWEKYESPRSPEWLCLTLISQTIHNMYSWTKLELRFHSRLPNQKS